MTNLLTFLGFFLFTSAGMVLIKIGAQPAQNIFYTVPILDFRLSAISLLGFFTYGLSFVLYSSLLTKYELTFLNPFTIGITSILIFICGTLFFNETITLAKLLGLVFIISGVLLINFFK